MNSIVWSKQNCPACAKAKNMLDSKGIHYEERIVGDGWTREQLLEAAPYAKSVPQIFLWGEYVGTYDNLLEYMEQHNMYGIG
jgi:glutaredoxin 3